MHAGAVLDGAVSLSEPSRTPNPNSNPNLPPGGLVLLHILRQKDLSTWGFELPEAKHPDLNIMIQGLLGAGRCSMVYEAFVTPRKSAVSPPRKGMSVCDYVFVFVSLSGHTHVHASPPPPPATPFHTYLHLHPQEVVRITSLSLIFLRTPPHF